MTVICPACDSESVRAVGTLPVFAADYLGRALDDATARSVLYACGNCALHFRHPMPTEEELKNYYGGLADEEWWQYGVEREVWRHIREAVAAAPARTVLDVGCFRGDLLSHLGSGWERFGVEPSADARRVAESRGVRVIGETVESLPETAARFGAITMIDVIEHLPRPLDSLKKLASLLQPQGRLVVFTGSTDALSWRLAGTQYWYSAMPEHVVFFCPSWFRWAAPQLGCEVVSVKRMPFNPSPPLARLNEALKNVTYIGLRRLASAPAVGALVGRLPLARRVLAWRESWWTSARDHILVTLVKRDG
jgi:SAM-dependent methyltransferase